MAGSALVKRLFAAIGGDINLAKNVRAVLSPKQWIELNQLVGDQRVVDATQERAAAQIAKKDARKSKTVTPTKQKAEDKSKRGRRRFGHPPKTTPTTQELSPQRLLPMEDLYPGQPPLPESGQWGAKEQQTIAAELEHLQARKAPAVDIRTATTGDPYAGLPATRGTPPVQLGDQVAHIRQHPMEGRKDFGSKAAGRPTVLEPGERVVDPHLRGDPQSQALIMPSRERPSFASMPDIQRPLETSSGVRLVNAPVVGEEGKIPGPGQTWTRALEDKRRESLFEELDELGKQAQGGRVRDWSKAYSPEFLPPPALRKLRTKQAQKLATEPVARAESPPRFGIGKDAPQAELTPALRAEVQKAADNLSLKDRKGVVRPAGFEDETGKLERATVATGLGTGLRSEEFLRLEVGDVTINDWGEHGVAPVIRVSKRRWGPNRGTPIKSKNSPREIELEEEHRTPLREWFERLEERPGGTKPDDLLFSAWLPHGKNSTEAQLKTAQKQLAAFVKRVGKATDLKAANPWETADYINISPHNFRHFYAQMLDQKGIDPAIGARMLGDTVQEYTKYARQPGQKPPPDPALLRGPFKHPQDIEKFGGEAEWSFESFREPAFDLAKEQPTSAQVRQLQSPEFQATEQRVTVALQETLLPSVGERGPAQLANLAGRMQETRQNVLQGRGTAVTSPRGTIVDFEEHELKSISDGNPKFSALMKLLYLPSNPKHLKGILKSMTSDEWETIPRSLAREAGLQGDATQLEQLGPELLEPVVALRVIADRQANLVRYLTDAPLQRLMATEELGHRAAVLDVQGQGRIQKLPTKGGGWRKLGIEDESQRNLLGAQFKGIQEAMYPKMTTPTEYSPRSTWWGQVQQAAYRGNTERLQKLLNKENVTLHLKKHSNLTFELLFLVGIYQAMPANLTQGSPNASN